MQQRVFSKYLRLGSPNLLVVSQGKLNLLRRYSKTGSDLGRYFSDLE